MTQRIIKFRAFNKVTGKMIDLKTITPLALQFGLEQDGLFLPFHEDWLLMQFTGLLDKNGVEIYEGDVLNTHWGNLVQAGVHNFRLCLIAISPSLRERCHHFDFVDLLRENDDHGEWTGRLEAEVIGNIYEHGHLLTPTDTREPV